MKREHNIESVVLPSGYRQLEYIESTGTQYIVTNLNTCTEHFKWYCKYKYVGGLSNFFTHSVHLSGYQNRIMSLLTVDGNKEYISGFHYVCGGSYTYPSLPIPIPKSEWIEVLEDFNQVNINGQLINLTKRAVTKTGYVEYFGYHYSSDDYGLCSGKAKRFKVWDGNDVLKSDCIPALRLGDNKPGLYDTVFNTFYTNQGTGEFLYE